MPDYSALPDSEINRLCAERVGWRVEEAPYRLSLIAPDGLVWAKFRAEAKCWSKAPDYCRDRNALVELWEFAKKVNREHDFVIKLNSICSDSRKSQSDQDFDIITATPRQHAEAFLRATEGQG